MSTLTMKSNYLNAAQFSDQDQEPEETIAPASNAEGAGHTPRVLNRGRIGFALEWPDGFTSAMPSEQAAQQCAQAPSMAAELATLRREREQLREALRRLWNLHDNQVFICGQDDEEAAQLTLEEARAALDPKA